MKKAALFVNGKIVVANSHLEAFGKLSEKEKDSSLVSGFYDAETNEFDSDMEQDHFYDKDLMLIRHAEAKAVADPDPPLAPSGIRQARELAQALSEIDDIRSYRGFTSPLLRCLQTCAYVSELTQIDFLVEPDIVETPAFLNENEEFFVYNRCEQFPQFHWPDADGWTLRPEPHKKFLERARIVLSQLPHKAIVITHYGFIVSLVDVALCHKKSQEVLESGLPNASVTYIHRNQCDVWGSPHEGQIQH